MSDLITKKSAMHVLELCRFWSEGERKYAFSLMEQLPSAEPEVIHCKDCRHGVDYYHEGDCYCSNPKLGLMYFGGSWEFYCADAERRTDG